MTGREHRDIQRYIVSVIAEAVPRSFLVAIRSLMNFRYLAQSRVITDETCSSIDRALQEFHSHKHAIIDEGARRGEKSIIDHWYIPKLEFFQSVVSNIRQNGVAIQWSADITKHANITAIKDPARSGNNNDYEPQICRYLDRLDKIRQFDLATSIREARIDFRKGPGADEDSLEVEGHGLDESDLLLVTSSSSLLTHIDPVSSLSGPSRQIFDCFYRAAELKRSLSNRQDVLLPLRTQACTRRVAFHLGRDPSYKRLLVDEVAVMYRIPDLRPALSDYLQRTSNNLDTQNRLDVGGRRLSQAHCDLPFSHLEVWKKVYLQSKTYHYPHTILPAQAINALPPLNSPSSLAQFDNVIMNIDPAEEWPSSGLTGVSVSLLSVASNSSNSLFIIHD